jgi:hypothetical protein
MALTVPPMPRMRVRIYEAKESFGQRGTTFSSALPAKAASLGILDIAIIGKVMNVRIKPDLDTAECRLIDAYILLVTGFIGNLVAFKKEEVTGNNES